MEKEKGMIMEYDLAASLETKGVTAWQLGEIAEEIHRNSPGTILIDIVGVDRIASEGVMDLNYLFLDMEKCRHFCLKVPWMKENPPQSLRSIWKGAEWMERELFDLLGVEVHGGPGESAVPEVFRERLFLAPHFQGHPLRKDFSSRSSASPMPSRDRRSEEGPSDVCSLRIPPFHPHVQGAAEMELTLHGERVRTVGIKIGYHHRGVEKILEGKTYGQIGPYMDRLNVQGGPIGSQLWCMGVEELFGLDIPSRAKSIRMIFWELARIQEHLLTLGRMSLIVGIRPAFFLAEENRELVQNLWMQLAGEKVFGCLSTIGGVSSDLSSTWMSLCLKRLSQLQKNILWLHDFVSHSMLWRRRAAVGRTAKEEILNWGVTGPCLRAAGLNHDMRKARPYYHYAELDFTVPLGPNGDVYDRFLVRVEEIIQSCKIVEQLLAYLPAGPVNVPLPEGQMPQMKEVFASIEGPSGQVGIFIVPEGHLRPYRVKIKSPSLPLMQMAPKIMEGHDLSDIFLIFASLNIVPSELER